MHHPEPSRHIYRVVSRPQGAAPYPRVNWSKFESKLCGAKEPLIEYDRIEAIQLPHISTFALSAPLTASQASTYVTQRHQKGREGHGADDHSRQGERVCVQDVSTLSMEVRESAKLSASRLLGSLAVPSFLFFLRRINTSPRALQVPKMLIGIRALGSRHHNFKAPTRQSKMTQ